jgi:hypothetical protein
LIEIIKSGGIPLVSVHIGPYNKAEIRIEKASPSTRYTAISHVWSDGLGNPNSNALPQCQLGWLSTCLERLPSVGYQGIYYEKQDGVVLDAGGFHAISRSNVERPVPLFWMDTLCIPVDSGYDELRREAINKMAAYYAQAAGILILDSELQTLRIAELEATEVLARIAYCAWAGRCWTLQEGAISLICYFQCADGALQLVENVGIIIVTWRSHALTISHGQSHVMRLANGLILYLTTPHLASFSINHHSMNTTALYVIPRGLPCIRSGSEPTEKDSGRKFRSRFDTSASEHTMSSIESLFRDLGRGMGQLGQQVQSWLANKQRANKQSAPVHALALNELFLGIILDDYQVRSRVFENKNLDLAMRINEKVQNSRFVTVWNELSQRTTTKFEDIYIILANLLDFNARQIMKLPAEERMKTILWSGRYVPLSILYNDGPRINPGKNYRERWIPSTPRGNTLKPSPKLEFVADGLLLPSLKAEEHTTMVLSKCLYINGYCFMVNAERQKVYLVKAVRADPDEFQTDSNVATCCIFEKADSSLHNGDSPELKGTCLSITDMKRQVYDSLEDPKVLEKGSSKASIRLVAIYDCPIRVWEVERSGMIPASERKEYELLYKTEPAPIVQIECLKSQWEVILQTGMPTKNLS